MASDSGYWVELENGSTKLNNPSIPELVRDAERKGVSGWVQPVLAFPNNPVVLVEGHIDTVVLSHVAKLQNNARLRFISLPQLDPAEKGAGKDSIINYLKKHGGLISNRPREAPLIVVLDWDVPTFELQSAQKAYGKGGKVAVLRMNPSHCPSELGEDFKGIERFYPAQVIEDAEKANELSIGRPSGRAMTVSPSELSRAKSALLRRVQNLTDVGKFHSLNLVLDEIENAISQF